MVGRCSIKLSISSLIIDALIIKVRKLKLEAKKKQEGMFVGDIDFDYGKEEAYKIVLKELKKTKKRLK